MGGIAGLFPLIGGSGSAIPPLVWKEPFVKENTFDTKKILPPERREYQMYG